jgi:putative phosphoribosyl transferase
MDSPVRWGGAERSVEVALGSAILRGDMYLTSPAAGAVIFAHGSGSSRRSPRNRYVARRLRDAGLGTLLFDLLTEDEEEEDRVTARLRFDISLLAARLSSVTDWFLQQPDAERAGIGYFGASTGAAAALIAAAWQAERVRAVVSRGGRPDLAGAALESLAAPVLLIVGGADMRVLDLNRTAQQRLRAENRLEVIPGATHLFEEPGALEEVARLASEWFVRHLGEEGAAPTPG